MGKESILIIDDNYIFVQGLTTSLVQEGYEIFSAANGAEGLKLARRLLPSLIILDINMPVMDGLTVCGHIRDEILLAKIPILLLTSKQSIDDRVAGLDQGADDYLTKPFDTKEMKARVRALLRRVSLTTVEPGSKSDHVLELGVLKLDLNARQVEMMGHQVTQLTPAEFELLHYLMMHPNMPFTSEELLEGVWSYQPGTADPSLVRWHIKNLRLKMESDPKHPRLIRTLSRHGYVLDKSTLAELSLSY